MTRSAVRPPSGSRARRLNGLARAFLLAIAAWPAPTLARDEPSALQLAPGWKAELVAQAPEILFPTAIVAAPGGTIYLGQDPMDMPGPPTRPIDSVLALHPDGRRTLFAEGLWAVMGLEWADGTLYVVHAPFLSAFKDTDGDGRADERVDLVTGLGPEIPGFSGINDHVASGVRLGMDGFLYIAVGDKGIPKAVGLDGATIRLFGGGVVRVRPDGTGLEVVSTGERNPLSVALSATDEIFTYGNDDDSKKWPNSLTHHIVGAHFGYPYEFLAAPTRCLPIVAGQLGGSGTQGICYLEDGLPAEYRGDLFFCDWGLSSVFRYTLEPVGATYRLVRKSLLVGPGTVKDFRPFSITAAPDGRCLYLVDWAFPAWLADGPKTGRLFRLTYEGPDAVAPAPRSPLTSTAAQIAGLDHPARSVRLESQRRLAAAGAAAELTARFHQPEPTSGRLHALWALDAINTPEARTELRGALSDASAQVRVQAARSAGLRADREARPALVACLGDPDATVRREAAIALGRLGDPEAGPELMRALAESDPFAAWSVRTAIRNLKAWDTDALTAALVDPDRREAALRLTDEVWAVPVVDALIAALGQTVDPAVRLRLVANLAGLYRRYPEWTGHWFGTNPLAGTQPQKSRNWSSEGMARVAAGMIGALGDADPGVRLRAIEGLAQVGAPAARALRARLEREEDPKALAALVGVLGSIGDAASTPALTGLVRDGRQSLTVRTAALDALARIPGPDALRARMAVAFDRNLPTELIARTLPALARANAIPANDLATFLDQPAEAVRVAALESLAMRRPIPEEARQAALARLDDPAPEVRRAALTVVAASRLREAIPKVLELAEPEPTRSEARRVLAALPDPRALDIYLALLGDRDAIIRRGGESALLALRDAVGPELERRAQAGEFQGPAAEAVERVLTRFVPISDWKVIGPFARTTAQVFVGEASIDFGRTHSGVEGRTIGWTDRAADPATGRVELNDFKGGIGDRGGFGYDVNGSPDLCSFGTAEVHSDRDREALLLIGSSGSLMVQVNGQTVFNYSNFAGRPFATDSDRVRVSLRQGANRILVKSRQGIGVWSFGVQISLPEATLFASRNGATDLGAFRQAGLTVDGDAGRGKALFFDSRGIGCVKCHKVGGEGESDLGPDLTGLALKYDRAEVIRSVLEPSSRIATGYQPALLALADGQVLTGLVREETDTEVVLIDADARTTHVPKDRIDERRTGDVSIMPGGLIDALKPAEFADLIAYLLSLKSPAAEH